MIQLENVHKSYGQTKVLKGIDLQIQDQDDVVILGPSGSGKSTLLNVLSGLEKVDEGHILIQGQDLSQLTDAKLTAFRRENIAFIFQQYYLLPNLTVRQNVKMGANLANNHDFLQIIEDLGLGDKLDKYPSELSGGEQQRVSIARLSGLEKVDEGHILIQGQDLSQLTDAKLTAFRRENIAFIFQQYYLLPNLTVRQNVKMGANLANNHDFLQIIEDLGLGDKLDKYPSELSGGEQQRVSIARALAKKPEILFLDEPTGALDEETGRKILDYIWKLKEKLGFTLIMVTHNQNIADMARTIIRVNSGKITEVVTNDQPQTAYEIGW